MIEAWLATGREVAVVGLGKSGIAAGRLLRTRGVPVYASDSQRLPPDSEGLDTLRRAGAVLDLGQHDCPRIARAVAVIVAPGVPPDAPPLRAAREAGVPIIAETALGLSALASTRLVALTGTNGKTTTTALTAHALRAGGIDIEVAGNIGTPVSAIALRAEVPAWLALELSSFQLHDMPEIAPEIGVLTNLSPNHLDRYGTLEEYYADKALLFRNATRGSCWVLNADDAGVRRMTDAVPGQRRYFSIDGPADAWYDRERDSLVLDGAAVLPRRELPLLGDHNVANALAVLLVAAAVGAAPEGVADGLRTFAAIRHRLEPIREVRGVQWINDSKSTNVTSTTVAVSAVDRPVVLLLGGRHKGAPYTSLLPALAGARGVVVYGEAADMVLSDLQHEIRVSRAETFEEAVAMAAALSRPGDAVLLSPACSSYDMFRNYEERGDRFRSLVAAME